MYFPKEEVSQGMAVYQKNPMLTELPLIMSGGAFKSMSSMNEGQLEKFLSYVVRFTCHKYKLSPFNNPPWWTENITYHPEFYIGQVPLPYTRNKAVKLKRLIRLCYISNNCKDLLNLSEKLAVLHALSYKFVRNTDGTVTVMQVSSKTPIVMIPSSNLDYDLDITSNSYQREISIIPIRKTLMAYDTKPKLETKDDDVNNCIIIDDSSSDDDVEIIYYEKGAFPPTPPKKKLPLEIQPGPACSKLRLKSADIWKMGSPYKCPAPSNIQVDNLKSETEKPSIVPGQQNPLLSQMLRQPVQKIQTQIRPQNSIHKPSAGLGSVPRPAPLAVTSASKYLRVRPKRLRQTYTIVDIDLTIDDDNDDEPEKKARHPSEMSQDSFLTRLGLCSKGSNPLENNNSSPVITDRKSKSFNLKTLSFDMVPFLVRMGVLPKRCLCTQHELDQRTSFVEKYTRKDFECSRVTVKVRDRAAVAAVTRKCSVRVKRLNTADMRKWRKDRTTKL